MRIEQIRRSLTVHRLMPGVFLCFLCSVLLAANEECLTSEGLWAATSKTSTLYLPVIYLNPTKQIRAEGIYQCFISLAAASTERRTFNNNYYCRYCCCFPLYNAVFSQDTIGKSLQSWLIGYGKGPDLLYRPQT